MSGQDFRLSNIERCDCADKPTDQAQVVMLDRLVSRFCKALGEPIPEDAIRRAEQLAGAVDALREVRARIDKAPDDEMLDDVLAIVDRVLYPATPGGQ